MYQVKVPNVVDHIQSHAGSPPRQCDFCQATEHMPPFGICVASSLPASTGCKNLGKRKRTRTATVSKPTRNTTVSLAREPILVARTARDSQDQARAMRAPSKLSEARRRQIRSAKTDQNLKKNQSKAKQKHAFSIALSSINHALYQSLLSKSQASWLKYQSQAKEGSQQLDDNCLPRCHQSFFPSKCFLC